MKLKLFSTALAAMTLAAAAAAAVEAAPATPTLPDGRKLAIRCVGEGGPTVVVDAGLGGSGTAEPWASIATELSATTRVCLHDRAGRGGSDPVSGPRTSADVVSDLRAGLKAAGESGPFVLVGHSVGGINMRVFAGRHPADTAALVLVDASHPDQTRAWMDALPAPQAGDHPAIAGARAYLAQQDANPTANPEGLNLKLSADQARAVTSLGAVPVVVLTHSPDWKMVPDMPADLLKPLEDATQRLQKEQLRLSSRSVQFVSASGGHDLPNEDRALVLKGVLHAVAEARRR